MGTVGIEHRNIVTILQSYDYNEDLPNWAVYANKDQRAYYNGGDKQTGGIKLQEILEMIEAAGTQTIYTLRMYPESTVEIKSNTPHQASTTFMLNQRVEVTKNENGQTVIARYDGSGAGNNTLLARVNQLEADLTREREARHKAELKQLEDKFTAQIAGITTAAEEKGWLDRIIGVVEAQPEVIDKVMQPVERFLSGLLNIFDKNRANNPNPAPNYTPVNGTNAPDPEPPPVKQDPPMAQTTTHPEEVQELTDDQIEKIHDQQNDFMETIEENIGIIPLTLILEKMAKDPAYLLQLQALNKIVATVGDKTATEILQKFSTKDAGQMNTALKFL